MTPTDIIKQSQNEETFSRDQLLYMLSLPSDSSESYQIMAEARRISKELSDNKAEVHVQFALNSAPCKKNCKFCFYSKTNNIFNEESEIDINEAVALAKQSEREGANAIYIMTTADYDIGRFIEISQEVKRYLNPETVLIANIGDKDIADAKRIKTAGYTGVYHALRLREGKDTTIKPEIRIRSIKAFQEAGLIVGTCVEPIGPEHTNEELTDMILFNADIEPVYSGAVRRIHVPNSDLFKYGMISELRLSQIVAITRLAMPRKIKGNYTHEPCALGAIAGANLFLAEIGTNSGYTQKDTEFATKSNSIIGCKCLFEETNWETLKGTSSIFIKHL